MPPRRSNAPPPLDVDAARARLQEGKPVRVGIVSSGQFPDGVIGRVVRVGDPGVDGDEFIFVELPVGGIKDVVPFAVADLVPAGAVRSPSGTRVRSPGTRRTALPRVDSAPASNELSAPASNELSAPASNELSAPASNGPSSLVPNGLSATVPAVSTSRSAPSAALVPTGRSAPSAGPRPGPEADPKQPPGARDPKPAASKGDRGRGKRAPVTITVSTTGEDAAPWRVEARVGARIAVRAAPVSPARVWEIVQTLGDEKLSAAVRTLLDDHRRVALAKADALAAELAVVQAELKSFPAAP